MVELLVTLGLYKAFVLTKTVKCKYEKTKVAISERPNLQQWDLLRLVPLNFRSQKYELNSLIILIIQTTNTYLSSLKILAMKSRSHADYVISNAFQLKQNLQK